MDYRHGMLVVVTQDPRFGGGGAAQTDAFVDGARALELDADVRWVPHPALAGKRFTLDRVEAWRQLRGGHALAAELPRDANTWVVATSATAGYAAPLSGVEYDCWLGTTIDDEWRGRRDGLSSWRRAAFAAGLPTLRRVERRVLERARRIYATSRGSRTVLEAAAGREVGVLSIPIDLDAFSPEPDDAWASRLERPVLVFVGRADDPRKNINLLFDALPILQECVPEATVRLIGDPPRGPLPPGVHAVGRVASVAEHLRTASLFVLPSRQEGFGIVAAEALAAGVPVLSTRSGGPEELIERSGGGRLLETFEPEELAAVATKLLGDVATLAAMRKHGRAYVEREHAPAAFQTRLAEALGH